AMGEAESARRVVAPSLVAAPMPLAWLVEAEALYLTGALEQARGAAGRAVSLALDAAQRERLRGRLAELLPDADTGQEGSQPQALAEEASKVEKEEAGARTRAGSTSTSTVWTSPRWRRGSSKRPPCRAGAGAEFPVRGSMD